MSDISIPGVSGANNKYSELIESLMKIERVPLERAEEKAKSLDTKKSLWQGLNRDLNNLKESSKLLWSFENPFNERVASSSDENILTAAATREAAQEEINFKVLKTASGDKFISKQLDTKYKVPEGKYRFVVNEKEFTISYRGGSIKNFTDAINEKAEGYLKANLIRNTADSYIFSLEGLKTGAENKIFFAEDAIKFGVDTGILKLAGDSDFEIHLDNNTIRPWNINPIDKELIYAQNNSIVINPGGEAKLPFPDNIKIEDNFVLEYTIDVKNTLKDYKDPQPPPGPSDTGIEALTFEGLTIQGKSSIIRLPEWKPPEAPPFVSDLNVLFAESSGSLIALPPIEDTNGAEKKQIEIGKIARSLNSINLRNKNTDRTITISDIKIINPDVTGDYAVNNQIQKASNSKIEFEGIEIERPSNSIDDLLPGVTLNLKKASDDIVNLKIEPDRELIKESILSFVFNYTSLMEELQILTNREESVIDEIFRFSDEEIEQAKEKLGAFQGDITFMQLKSRLQQIVMNPYPTSAGDELSLLAQIGISTNSSGGGFDASKLRGYLEVNEEELDQALETKTEFISELFGYDSNNDLTVDTGVAYALDRYLNTYVQVGGLISSRVDTIDGQLDRVKDEIESYEAKLKEKEKQYKIQYGMMEGDLNKMENTSNRIDSYFNNGNN